ncbi:hypothetical protein VTI74DRAFT_10698 [Chaetomium olivicolor]
MEGHKNRQPSRPDDEEEKTEEVEDVYDAFMYLYTLRINKSHSLPAPQLAKHGFSRCRLLVLLLLLVRKNMVKGIKEQINVQN